MQKNQISWPGFFLALALALGALVRFLPTMESGTPLNDGGMFYVMISDLRANHFLIPASTSYNLSNIPYAYPPLAFYAAGLLSAAGMATVEVLRWIPPLLSTLSILAFYGMTSTMLGSRSNASLAALAYALMPRLFSWYVMGGGLSRSFGVLFLLLACTSAWRLFSLREPRYLLSTALFGAAAVLSHPETGLHTAAACTLIWLFKGRTWRGTRDAAIVALGVIVLTSPWWATVLGQHGLAPFVSSVQTGGHNALFWLPWLTFSFAEERFATLLTVLGLLGLAVQCARRDWFLPLWLLAPFAVEPRSATAIAAIPLAILAGLGLSEVVIPALAGREAGRQAAPEWTEAMSRKPAVRIVLGYVTVFALIGAVIYDFSLSNYTVPAGDRQAMAWVLSNTPADSHFVIITGRADPFEDPVSEWFPAFSLRNSRTTIQGQEWTLGSRFMTYLGSLAQLQSCLNAEPGCVDSWASSNRVDFQYLYIDKPSRNDQNPGLLLYLLRQSQRYHLVFENSSAVIFARASP